MVPAGELFDQLPHGPDSAPEQPGPHRGDGCGAQGGRRLGQFGHVDLRQEIGEFVQCPGRHGNARQDRTAEEGAVGIDQIDRDGRAGIDDDRRAAGRPQAIGGQGVQQPIDADHVGPRQLDDQRQIARGQQHDFIVRAMIAEPVDQPRRCRAVDAADVPAEGTAPFSLVCGAFSQASS